MTMTTTTTTTTTTTMTLTLHLAERPGQMRISNDAVIINSLSFFFLFLSLPPSLPPLPPPPPPPSNIPQLICTSREAVNWRSERGFFPYRETQRDSTNSVLTTRQLDVYLGKLYIGCVLRIFWRISRDVKERRKMANGLVDVSVNYFNNLYKIICNKIIKI